MNIDDIKQRMHAASLSWFEIDGLRFQLRRPNQLEALRIVRQHQATDDSDKDQQIETDIDILLPFIEQWDVPLSRLFPLADDTEDAPAPFDPDLARQLFIKDLTLGTQVVGELFRLIADKHDSQDAEKKP